jgi:hypothetical protein
MIECDEIVCLIIFDFNIYDDIHIWRYSINIKNLL